MGKTIGEKLEERHLLTAETEYRKIVKDYDRTYRGIVSDAKAFIGEFSRGNGGEDLAKVLSPMDKDYFAEYDKTLADLIDSASDLENDALDKIIDNILLQENPTYVDGFINMVDTRMAIANAKAEDTIGNHMSTVYVESFQETGTALGCSFTKPNKRVIEKVVNGKWLDGVTFSSALWGKNQDPLVKSIQNDILQGVLSGEDSRKTARRLREHMATSTFNAERVIRTETNRIHNCASIEAYMEAGVKEYRLLTAIDSATSKICRNKDTKKKHKCKEYVVGVNAPPFHPHCRTTVIYVDPYEDEADNPDDTSNKTNSQAIEQRDKAFEDYANEYKETKSKLEDIKSQMDDCLDDLTDKNWDKMGELSTTQKKLQKELKQLRAQSLDKATLDIEKFGGYEKGKVDFKGISIETLEGVHSSTDKLFKKYPKLKRNLGSIDMSERGYGCYASCHPIGGNIHLNPAVYKDVTKISQRYATDLMAKYHPAGTDWTAVFTHEFGHAIDGYLTVNEMHGAGWTGRSWKRASTIAKRKVMSKLKLRQEDIRDELSYYATDSPAEWFAEAFAEYIHSDSPRPIAQELGKLLDEWLK